METGKIAPDFCLQESNGDSVCLRDLKGKWVILYFYPKDNTPGCTTEGIEFSQFKQEFDKRNAVILGVSPDSIKSHCNFRDKHHLTVQLLSDPEKEVIQKYGVWQLKKQYGREYYGVVRSTFIIDPEGKIAAVWNKVKVKGHVEQVLAKLEELQHIS
ncbi:MAG: thioredoxin-dependent thiol peroxidase [Calditrichia bacterium]